MSDLTDEEISRAAAGYLHSQTLNQVHDHVMTVFSELSNERLINKALIARRLGKDPAQVNRLLAAPGNWTMETLSDLLMAMGRMATIDSVPVISQRKTNECPVAHEGAVYAKIVKVPVTASSAGTNLNFSTTRMPAASSAGSFKLVER